MAARPSRGSGTTSERGTLLLPVVFMTFLLGVLSMNFLSEGLTQRADTGHAEASVRALEIAEMGLSRAEMELRANTDPDGDGVGTLTGSFRGGTYTVRASLEDAAENRYELSVTGRHGHAVRRIRVGIHKPNGSLFPYALFGKDSVEFGSGGATDAYDARLGHWSTQITGSDANGNYADSGGHIGSNGWVKLSVGTIIRGDAIPGPFDTIDKGTIWGSKDPRAEEVEVPDTPFAAFQDAWASNDNASLDLTQPGVTFNPVTGSLKLDGAPTIEFTGGTYFFSDFTFGSNAKIIVSGPTRLYLTGAVKLQGTWQNVSGLARDMLIFNHPYALPPGYIPPAKEFTSDGGWNSAMAVYAPALHVELKSSGDLFGAAVANSLKFGGTSQFHYDRSLLDVSGGSGDGNGTTRLYWIEE